MSEEISISRPDPESDHFAEGPPTEPAPARYVFTPPIDIFENEEGLVLRADLPGVEKETLDLQIQDNRLTLFGRVTHYPPPSARIAHQEYQVGDYLRSFILSDQVDYDRITAKLVQGVLEITLPRAPQAEPRRIQIQSD